MISAISAKLSAKFKVIGLVALIVLFLLAVIGWQNRQIKAQVAETTRKQSRIDNLETVNAHNRGDIIRLETELADRDAAIAIWDREQARLREAHRRSLHAVRAELMALERRYETVEAYLDSRAPAEFIDNWLRDRAAAGQD